MIMGSDVRADREIVDDILKEARKVGAEVPGTRITEWIETLRTLKPDGPPFGNRRLNKKYAAKVISLIDECMQMLADPPKDFSLNYLFYPPDSRLLPPVVAYRKAEQRHDCLATLLSEVRNRCEGIIEYRFGEHGRSGYQQQRAAMASRQLLESSGIPLQYSSSTSAYRTIARLFFEAMTGTCSADGADIERACEAVVRSPDAALFDQLWLVHLLVRSSKP
jgi:hypothetical protein